MKRKALYLPEDLHRRLRLYAESDNRTMVLQIRNWLDLFFKEKRANAYENNKQG